MGKEMGIGTLVGSSPWLAGCGFMGVLSDGEGAREWGFGGWVVVSSPWLWVHGGVEVLVLVAECVQ